MGLSRERRRAGAQVCPPVPRVAAKVFALGAPFTLWSLATPARAQYDLRGEAVAHEAPSAASVVGCVMLARMPGGRHRTEGERQARDLCATDIHNGTHALCTRPFSPGPGTLVYDLAAGRIPAASRTEHVAAWMRDLVDMTLPGQQDRIGDVDCVPHWVWVGVGVVHQRLAPATTTPADIADLSTRLLKRTEPGDNCAGIRTGHANFTQRTGTLDRMRHDPPETDRRLMTMARDFDVQGPPQDHVQTSHDLCQAEFARIATDERSAADILPGQCRAGRLRFDLDPEALLRDGTLPETRADCDRP